MKVRTVALETESGAVAVRPCQYVTLEGETFALHRAVDGKGWTVSDIETGAHIAHGSTQANALDRALRGLRGLNPGSLQRARGNAPSCVNGASCDLPGRLPQHGRPAPALCAARPDQTDGGRARSHPKRCHTCRAVARPLEPRSPKPKGRAASSAATSRLKGTAP